MIIGVEKLVRNLKLTMRFVFDFLRVAVCTVAIEMKVVF